MDSLDADLLKVYMLVSPDGQRTRLGCSRGVSMRLHQLNDRGMLGSPLGSDVAEADVAGTWTFLFAIVVTAPISGRKLLRVWRDTSLAMTPRDRIIVGLRLAQTLLLSVYINFSAGAQCGNGGGGGGATAIFLPEAARLGQAFIQAGMQIPYERMFPNGLALLAEHNAYFMTLDKSFAARLAKTRGREPKTSDPDQRALFSQIIAATLAEPIVAPTLPDPLPVRRIPASELI